MGARIREHKNVLEIEGGFHLTENLIHCAESALAARLMIPVVALENREFTIDGAPGLRKRRLGNIETAMKNAGVFCRSDNDRLPVTIKGSLQGGEITIDASETSQLLSGLLMALPLADRDSRIHVQNPSSRPYLDMTLQILEQSGIQAFNRDYQVFEIPGRQTYRPFNIQIEGDWSGAAFLMVAAALAGDLEINGLNQASKQADRAVLSAFENAGINIEIAGKQIKIRKSRPKPFTFDAADCPDLFPPLAVLAAFAVGKSTINGRKRLANKESARDKVLQKELGKLGVDIELEVDRMIVHGGNPTGGIIDSHHDHRIAMAAAVMGFAAREPVTIKHAECVSKSYPGFFEEMSRIALR